MNLDTCQRCIYCQSAYFTLLRADGHGWWHVNCANCEAWAGRVRMGDLELGPALVGHAARP